MRALLTIELLMTTPPSYPGTQPRAETPSMLSIVVPVRNEETARVGVEALLECHSFRNIRIGGGGNDANASFGMSRAFRGALRATPECWAGSLGVVRAAHVEVLGPPTPIADGRVYFPRPPSSHPVRHFSHRFTASGDALLVTNPFQGYSGVSRVRVRANGGEIDAVAHNDPSWLFASPSSGAETTWDVDYDASDDERVDLAVINGTGEAGAPPCDGVLRPMSERPDRGHLIDEGFAFSWRE